MNIEGRGRMGQTGKQYCRKKVVNKKPAVADRFSWLLQTKQIVQGNFVGGRIWEINSRSSSLEQ